MEEDSIKLANNHNTVNNSNPSTIKLGKKTFTKVGEIKREDQHTRKRKPKNDKAPELPVFDIPNKSQSDKKGLYLFTLCTEHLDEDCTGTNCQSKTIIYVGQTARTFSERMKEYTAGGYYPDPNCQPSERAYVPISNLSNRITKGLSKPLDFPDLLKDKKQLKDFKNEIYKVINVEEVDNTGTTNRRIAYFFYEALKNNNTAASIWCCEIEMEESKLIKKHEPLLNDKDSKKSKKRSKKT